MELLGLNLVTHKNTVTLSVTAIHVTEHMVRRLTLRSTQGEILKTP
ncbi:hypothetical protein BDW_04385 [Bdellovibrio bacteriovorus W]|nr:hypothetical protein BDW_04385 [Bdellovibrio bacteriovorus W]